MAVPRNEKQDEMLTFFTKKKKKKQFFKRKEKQDSGTMNFKRIQPCSIVYDNLGYWMVGSYAVGGKKCMINGKVLTSHLRTTRGTHVDREKHWRAALVQFYHYQAGIDID